LFGKQPKPEPEPTLAERIEQIGPRRLAVLGLHPRAGTRTVVEQIAVERRRTGRPVGVVSFPRAFLPDQMLHEPETAIRLAAGTAFTAEASPGDDQDEIEVLGVENDPALEGTVWFCRALRETVVHPTLVRSSDAVAHAASRLAIRIGGPVLVDGGWTDREFAAPGRCDAWLLCVGAGFSEGVERIAAAVRYEVDRFSLPGCGGAAVEVWDGIADQSGYVVMTEGEAGFTLRSFPEAGAVCEALMQAYTETTVLVPRMLSDELLAPLARKGIACRLVLRDPTRQNVSPVYLKSWQKAGGIIEVVQPTSLLAVTTNPTNFVGPDVDPELFRGAVQNALGPAVPTHDVMLDSKPEPGPRWKFWG
jgi:hypothetical protein